MVRVVARKTEWHEALVRQLIHENGGLTPQEIIERHADDLRSTAQQDSLPIKPRLIASFVGIKRRSGPHDFAGRIYAEPSGQLVMDIRETDSEERQHFTEAHELIHAAFPGFETDGRYRLDATMERHAENKEEEFLCDLGAAALLMPRNLVENEYAVRNGLEDAERLARDAEVSVEAAANRLIALADEPCVLLCLTWANKPADRSALRKGQTVAKALRVSYALTNHLDLYVPKFKSAPNDSVFTRARTGSTVQSDTTTLPGASHAGLFRIQAKCYGAENLERVLAIGRPTA
jgi:hypothetical protein